VLWESTSLVIEIRGGDFPSGLGPWITVESSGDPVSDYIDPADRYLQYRVNLSSGDATLSPFLESIRITRNR